MPKLILKFGNSVLKEVAVSGSEVSIGRSPENGMMIDNPAVSHFHARVFSEEGRLMLQDFGSLNGTFVNGQRVKMVTLKAGDSVEIGKHTIVVSESRDLDQFAIGNGKLTAAAPKLNETVMLDTKERREFLQKVAAVGESAQVAPAHSDREILDGYRKIERLVRAQSCCADKPARGSLLLHRCGRPDPPCEWPSHHAANQAFCR